MGKVYNKLQLLMSSFKVKKSKTYGGWRIYEFSTKWEKYIIKFEYDSPFNSRKEAEDKIKDYVFMRTKYKEIAKEAFERGMDDFWGEVKRVQDDTYLNLSETDMNTEEREEIDNIIIEDHIRPY